MKGLLALSLLTVGCALITPLDDLRIVSDAGPDVQTDAACSQDLSSDGLNCGACGHSCLGGACSGGTCQPVVLASGQSNANAIAVGGGYVYWTEFAAGAVKRCPVTGCGSKAEIVAQVAGSYTMGLAIDTTTAYFSAKLSSNVVAGTIYAVPLDGSSQPIPIATSQDHPVWLTIDQTNVYWANWGDGRIMYCHRGNCGTPTTLHTQTGGPNSGPNGLASTGTSVYWVSDDGNARYCSLASCATPTVFATGQLAPTGIAVDATSTYWANQGSNNVMKCLLSGCGNNPTPVASNEAGAYAVAVDSSGIYWTDASGGLVRTCPTSGCGSGPTTLASKLVQPANIALDTDAVYVAVYGTAGQTDGAVVKIAK
jgi:hypothetical protein